MKKSKIITLVYAALIIFGIIYLLVILPSPTNVNAATVNEEESLKKLNDLTTELALQINTLNSNISTCEKGINTLERRLSELEVNTTSMQSFLVDYYIDRLKDPTYTDVYNEGTTWYTAAENLGCIGKAAIPPLISRLNTTDDYERALALYALSLASQAENVKCFSDDHPIATHLDFDARNHPAQVQIALKWWDTYKSFF